MQGYEPIHGLITWKIKAVFAFETSGSNYPTTRDNNLEDLLSQYKNRFARNKIS
jgi:hypothetical protein